MVVSDWFILHSCFNISYWSTVYNAKFVLRPYVHWMMGVRSTHLFQSDLQFLKKFVFRVFTRTTKYKITQKSTQYKTLTYILQAIYNHQQVMVQHGAISLISATYTVLTQG